MRSSTPVSSNIIERLPGPVGRPASGHIHTSMRSVLRGFSDTLQTFIRRAFATFFRESHNGCLHQIALMMQKTTGGAAS
jgi:hypothetical protein